MNAITVPYERAGASQPLVHQRSSEIQRFDQLRDMRLELSEATRGEMVSLLNKVAAGTRILRDLYKGRVATARRVLGERAIRGGGSREACAWLHGSQL